MTKITTFFSMYSVLIPIAIGISTWKRLDIFFWILLLCFFSFGADICAKIWALLWHNNYVVSHLWHIAQALILGVFFKAFTNSKFILFFSIVYALGYGSYTFLIVGPNVFVSEIRVILNLFFIAVSIFTFYIVYQREESIFIDQTPIFWINLGVLIYFGGSLFSWLMVNYITLPNNNATWALHNLSNGLKNILFAIGLWKVRTTV